MMRAGEVHGLFGGAAGCGRDDGKVGGRKESAGWSGKSVDGGSCGSGGRRDTGEGDGTGVVGDGADRARCRGDAGPIYIEGVCVGAAAERGPSLSDR